MNKLFSVSLIAASLAISGPGLAGHKHDRRSYQGVAKVLSVKPLYETVRISIPHRECWRERIHRRHHHGPRHTSYTAPIAGAILGGVVGNQFGKGSGKDALTVGGALLGASIGNDVNQSHCYPRHSGPRYQRRCKTVHSYETREELVGYRVKYLYDGEIHHTRMDHDPGDTIRVKVKVRPLG